jgi:DNA (cytosine-5)-methyltransferase 1
MMPADGSLFGLVRGPRVVDLFAGGGGASLGIRSALGVSPIVAINHCNHAIRMHTLNHPETEHYHASVYDVAPLAAARGRAVDLLWASPDCTHFSRAKGGKPRETGRRALAWVVVDWARDVRPRCIALENVPEFATWGPLRPDGQPDKARSGEDFRAFVGALEQLGYRVEWRVLSAADYGAPTSRRRLFLIARCDGQALTWPEPTHGPGRARAHRTAAECIDWSIPAPSIFERSRPLADATLRRIAEGVVRYVLRSPRPYLLCLSHGGRLEPINQPLRTVTAGPVGGDRALVVPSLVQTGYGERRGQAPRALDIGAPLGTVVGGGSKHALVAAFLAKHYTGVVGHEIGRPVGTVTGIDHHAVVAAFLDKLHGSARAGQPVDAPAPTVTTGGGRGGGHAALVAAFLARYHGTGGQWAALDAPGPCVTAREGLALVTVDIRGEKYVLTDIGMRMLQPRELARAQGFPDDYRIELGSKGDQVARIGNSVCPPVAEAIARALLA